MGRFGRHVRGNIVGYIALFFAVGLGSAWAATELTKNEVKSKHIKAGAVKNADLADDAVTSKKVADGSLLGADFAAGQLPQGSQGPAGTDATKLFAAVGSTGNLMYGSGATAATRSGTGDYLVTFDRSLSNCVAMAESGRGEPEGAYGVEGGPTFANANDIRADNKVRVLVWHLETNGLADRAFTLAVFC